MARILRTRKSNAARRVGLIGAPADLGAGNRGAAFGPRALRTAGLTTALGRGGLQVVDHGDLGGLSNSDGRTIDGCRHLEEITAWCRAIRDSVGASLAAGELPVMIGGDHSLATGSVAAVARHCAERDIPLFMIWLDAHADFNTAETSPSGNVHGMPVSAIVGDGHDALTGLGHARPMLAVDRIVQIGVRSIDPLEAERITARGLSVYDMTAIRARGMRAVVGEALEGAVRAGGHLHVSFDVDFLDPTVAPGVGTPERGGPSLAEAETCMAMIRESGLVGSLDIVELNPRFDRGAARRGASSNLPPACWDRGRRCASRQPRRAVSPHLIPPKERRGQTVVVATLSRLHRRVEAFPELACLRNVAANEGQHHGAQPAVRGERQ
jgi:arginase